MIGLADEATLWSDASPVFMRSVTYTLHQHPGRYTKTVEGRLFGWGQEDGNGAGGEGKTVGVEGEGAPAGNAAHTGLLGVD